MDFTDFRLYWLILFLLQSFSARTDGSSFVAAPRPGIWFGPLAMRRQAFDMPDTPVSLNILQSFYVKHYLPPQIAFYLIIFLYVFFQPIHFVGGQRFGSFVRINFRLRDDMARQSRPYAVNIG